MASQQVARVQVLNATFDPLTLKSTTDKLVEAVRSGERGWLATVNVAILMMMRQDPALQAFADRAKWVIADGQPVVWLSRALGRPLPVRVAGIDVIDELCGRAEQEELTVFLLGASAEVIQRAAGEIRRAHPRLNLHYADGYFQDPEERVREINASGADILLVGMGVPRQEKFIMENWDSLTVTAAVGVGGSFDVISGLKTRAPRALQVLGLEWVHRLVQEPGRLWKRYLVTGDQFLWLSMLALIEERRGKSPAGLHLGKGNAS